MIRKITDGYYFGTQKDLEPIMLGGAELGSVYFATDTGVIYQGENSHAGRSIADGGSAWLNFKGRVNKVDKKSFLVSTECFARHDINYTAGGALKGLRFRIRRCLRTCL